MAAKAAPPKTPASSPMDDLIPRSMLPDRSGIPSGKEFGADIPRKKAPAPKKMAKGGGLPDLTVDGKITRADVLKGRGVFRKGGSVSSASKRADGVAVKGKTRGKIV